MGLLMRSGMAWGLVAAMVPATATLAATNPAANLLPFNDREDGISCSYFDVGLLVPWPDGKASWADAAGTMRGDKPFASLAVEPGDNKRVLRWDISALAKAWASGALPNDGLLVQAKGEGVEFHSREDEDITLRPTLLLKYDDGALEMLSAKADAALDCSTYKGVGHLPALRLNPTASLALRFDLSRLKRGTAASLRTAELVLVRTPGGAGRSKLLVQRLVSPLVEGAPGPVDGIAKGFSGDRGIAKHPDVLYADNFDAGRIGDGWVGAKLVPTAVLDDDAPHRFEPLLGKALRITIPRGGNLGLDLRYKFKPRHGREPDEVYFRYYLRLADNWMTASEGGKLPGLAGTYGQAAWGGRSWDGAKGWSMRGSFGAPLPKDHPAAGKLMIGNYTYHADGDPIYGEVMPWVQGGLIGTNRWVCVEQYLKLNTPRQKDGHVKVWVDGLLAFERSNLRIRDVPDLHIEEVWANFYVGGVKPAVADMTAYIDNVVIATRYIGPMAP